jgi:phasin family protein
VPFQRKIVAAHKFYCNFRDDVYFAMQQSLEHRVTDKGSRAPKPGVSPKQAPSAVKPAAAVPAIAKSIVAAKPTPATKDAPVAKAPAEPKIAPAAKPAPIVKAAAVTKAAPVAKAAPVVAAAVEPAAAAATKPIVKQIEAVTSPAPESKSESVTLSDIPLAAPLASALNEGSEQMATIENGAAKAQAVFGDAQARIKAAWDKQSKFGEEMIDFAKGNVEAVVASARVAAKHGEELGQEAADYSTKSFENAMAVFRGFASAKSPTELFQLQSDFAKSSFDSAVAEASKVSEKLLKIAGDVAQPLSNRYAVAAEKIKVGL